MKELSNLSDLMISGTYIVSKNVTGSGTYAIAKDVTLIFEGGRIMASDKKSVVLIGDNTVIQAPVTQIFGDNVNVEGTWVMPRAYPQWFDKNVGKDKQTSSPQHDASVAINKAIKMQISGEVFLPRGNYYISSPIEIPTGIHLVGDGESDVTHRDDLGKGLEGYGQDNFYGTCIIPYLKSTGSTAVSNGIIRINVTPDGSKWQAQYPVNYGEMSRIYIANLCGSLEKRVELAKIVCCIVGGGFTFDHVEFKNFARAIKWTEGNYADARQISDCYLSVNDDVKNGLLSLAKAEEKNTGKADKQFPCFYIDITDSNGDALSIRNVHANLITSDPDTSIYLKVLHLNLCYGGSVTDCILNGDVVIENCRAVEYANNHSEMGAQLKILGGFVNVSNNYMERGRRPSIVIGTPDGDSYQAVYSSMVNLSNNLFNAYFPIYSQGDVPRIPVNELSEYDIAISKLFGGVATVRISDCYRTNDNLYNSNQQTGLWLATFEEGASGEIESFSEFTDFNNYSPYLSGECTIMPGMNIVSQTSVSEMPTLGSAQMMINTQIANALLVPDSSIPSKPTVGSILDRYTYTFQPIVDPKRRIAGKSIVAGIISTDNDGEKNGNLIGLYGQSTDTRYMLRITRTPKLGGNTYSVDVPVIGNRFLYDNNYSVNGYVWKKVLKFVPDVKPLYNTGFERVDFINSRARCYGSQEPSGVVGQWQNTDEIVNLGNNSGQFIFNGTGWISL